MKSFAIDRWDTFFSSEFLKDYYLTDKLDAFRSYKPEIGEAAKAIESKENFSSEKRLTLVKLLKEQYQESGIALEGLFSENISHLKQDNTFTVTTGQQIHVGLGPMYVLYKALDTIVIASELKEKHPEHNFVPVFWMATEDHDLEEIASVKLFGKTITWETEQGGAVGRMTTEGLPELWAQIRSDFNFSAEQLAFIDTCEDIYKNAPNLSIAFRQLLHYYLGHLGIVILDPDNRELKESFAEVMINDLQQSHSEVLHVYTRKLEEKGYASQLHIRDCNLFELSANSRERITRKYSAEEAGKYVEDISLELSPNAALRPLYQEWILPNIVYVGGPSELKYWMQLKGIFNNYELPVPILHLRTSAILIPQNVTHVKSITDIEKLFDTEEQIVGLFSEELRRLKSDLDTYSSSIVTSLERFKDFAEVSFPGFSLDAKIKKITPKLDGLNALISEQIELKAKQNKGVNKVLKTRAKFFNPSYVQERQVHLIEWMQDIYDLSENAQEVFGFRSAKKISVNFL
ncbi:MAG: bacillithiol biosynthesis BshC [Bacteroidia bacterium]